MMCQYIKVRLEERTSDLIRLIIDIGLKKKHWINSGIIIDKSYNSYGL